MRTRFFNRRGRFIGVTVAIVAGALVVPAAGARGATTPPAAVSGNVTMGAESAVGTLAAKSYGAVYGGMAVINNQRQIAVYLTDPAPAIERAFDRIAPAGRLVFRKTSHSMEQLNAIQSSLQGKWMSLIKSGIDVNEFGSNPLTGKEDVGVVNLTARDASTLDHLYGSQALNVFNVTSRQADAARFASSRIADTPPFNGGDAIVSASDHADGCSSGFGIVIRGALNLLTAGHCYSVGTTVINARSLGGTAISGSGVTMGKVTESAENSEVDSEVISAPGSDLIWTGPIGNPQRATVSGVGTWAVGDQVCTSGAYGGEICGLTVQHVNYCMTFTVDVIILHYECHITQVQGARETVPGDSGGPVFRFNGSALEAVGTDTGFNASGNGVSWFTGIYAILGEWGASLHTG
jgi:hypothetical protein